MKNIEISSFFNLYSEDLIFGDSVLDYPYMIFLVYKTIMMNSSEIKPAQAVSLLSKADVGVYGILAIHDDQLHFFVSYSAEPQDILDEGLTYFMSEKITECPDCGNEDIDIRVKFNEPTDLEIHYDCNCSLSGEVVKHVSLFDYLPKKEEPIQ